MFNIKSLVILLLMITTFSSCEAISNIFSAGVWIGLTIAVIVLIVLFAVFRKRN